MEMNGLDTQTRTIILSFIERASTTMETIDRGPLSMPSAPQRVWEPFHSYCSHSAIFVNVLFVTLSFLFNHLYMQNAWLSRGMQGGRKHKYKE